MSPHGFDLKVQENGSDVGPKNSETKTVGPITWNY